MDDEELIVSLAGGDNTALRQLFDRHAPWLAARLRKALPSDDVGLIASAATLGTHAAEPSITAQLTFAWLLPMTAACAFALAVAVAVRSAVAGAGAGMGAWLTLVLVHSATDHSVTVHSATDGAGGELSATALTSAITDANLYLPYLAVAACCAVIVFVATRPQRGLL